MARIVLFFLLVLFCRLSFSESPSEEQAESSAQSGSWSVIRQATEARRRLEDVALDFSVRQAAKQTEKTIQAGTGKGRRAAIATQSERQVTRQFAIAALDEERRDWHTVLLDVAYPLPAAADFSFRVLSDGYLVKHLSGRGITKLNFEVHLLSEHRPLVPYGLKALWGTGRSGNNGTPDFEAAIYTPIYPSFHSGDLVVRGRHLLYAEAEGALAALQERGVRSRSFPQRLLADVIPADLLVNVGLIEQMDPAAFRADPHGSAAEVLMHYAVNGGDAFRWIQSSANARGAYQFIRATYELTVSACRAAALIPDFLRGTQDLRNMLKAAACLLDGELARMPEDAKELFDGNYRLGGIYPVAAYNGGLGKAKKLHATIKREAVDLSAEAVELPKSAFTHYKTRVAVKGGKTQRRVRITKRTFNSETYLYLQKYFFVWDVLDEFEKQSAGNGSNRPSIDSSKASSGLG